MSIFSKLLEKIADELNLKAPEQSPDAVDAAVQDGDVNTTALENNDGDKVPDGQPLLIDKLIAILPPPVSSPQPIESDGSEENPSSSTAGYKVASDKTAGIADIVMGVGKTLMSNKTLRNAAIGAGVGALGGAIKSQPGSRLSGALKGGLIGGVAGGVGTTLAKSINSSEFKTAPNLSSKLQVLKNTGMNDAKSVGSLLKSTYNTAKGQPVSNPMSMGPYQQGISSKLIQPMGM